MIILRGWITYSTRGVVSVTGQSCTVYLECRKSWFKMFFFVKRSVFHIGCALTPASLKHADTILAVQLLYINRLTLRSYRFCDVYWATRLTRTDVKHVISYLNGASKTSSPERINDFRKRQRSAVGSHLDLEATVAFTQRKWTLVQYFLPLIILICILHYFVIN